MHTQFPFPKLVYYYMSAFINLNIFKKTVSYRINSKLREHINRSYNQKTMRVRLSDNFLPGSVIFTAQ